MARRCGLGSPDTVRRHFARRRRTSPLGYRRAFRAASPEPDAPAPARAVLDRVLIEEAVH